MDEDENIQLVEYPYRSFLDYLGRRGTALIVDTNFSPDRTTCEVTFEYEPPLDGERYVTNTFRSGGIDGLPVPLDQDEVLRMSMLGANLKGYMLQVGNEEADRWLLEFQGTPREPKAPISPETEALLRQLRQRAGIEDPSPDEVDAEAAWTNEDDALLDGWSHAE